jgi:hypothetical protein
MNPLSNILIVEVGKIDDPGMKGEKLTIVTAKNLSVEVEKIGELGKTGENRHRSNDISTRLWSEEIVDC